MTGSPGYGARASRQLLGEVRDRLDQLEAELSQREQHLTQAERELREAGARLQGQRAKLAQERERAEKQLASQISENAKRIQAHVSALRDREQKIEAQARRERALTAHVESLSHERDKAAAQLESTHRQLADARRQLAESQQEQQGQRERLRVLEEAIAAREREPGARDQGTAGADRPPAAAPVPAAAAGTESGAPPRPGPGVIRRTPWATAAMVGAVVLATSAALGAWAYTRYQPTYRVIGEVTTPPGDAGTINACREEAAAQGLAFARVDVDKGVLELVKEDADVSAAVGLVNRVGRAIAARFQPARRPRATRRPSRAAERQEHLDRIREIDRGLAQLTTQPAEDLDDRAPALIDAWSAARAERTRIGDSLTALAGSSLLAWPDEAAVPIDPARLEAAEQADRRLQADVEAVSQREAAFADTLRRLLADGDASFNALSRAAAAGETHVAKALQGDHSGGVRQSLGAVRAAMADWSKASAALAKVWRQARDALARSQAHADPLACQADLDRAARVFVDDASVAQVAFQKALEAVGQDADEPTKALVLRRTLTRELEAVVEARQQVESAARSMMLTDNVGLAAVVQQVAGLRRQVQEQRARIEASVRRQMLADLRAKRENEVRAERERLTQRAAQLDRAIAGYVAEAEVMIRQGGQDRSALAQRVALERERAERFKSVAAIDEATARALADDAGISGDDALSGAAPPAGEVRYVPARVERAGPDGRRTTRALLVGGGSLLAWLVLGAGLYAARAWRRSKETIEACTLELQAASRAETMTEE